MTNIQNLQRTSEIKHQKLPSLLKYPKLPVNKCANKINNYQKKIHKCLIKYSISNYKSFDMTYLQRNGNSNYSDIPL